MHAFVVLAFYLFFIPPNEQHKLDQVAQQFKRFHALKSPTVAQCNQTLAIYDRVYASLSPEARASDGAKAIDRDRDAIRTQCAADTSAAGAEAEQHREYAALLHELTTPERSVINTLVQTYDGSRFQPPGGTSGFTLTPAAIADAKAQLATVREVCHRHPHVAGPEHPPDTHSIYSYPEALCDLAERGDAIVQKLLVDNAMRSVTNNNTATIANIQEILDGKRASVPESIQQLAFETAAWRAARDKVAAPDFALANLPVPPAAYDDAIAKAKELVAKIDHDAPQTPWVAPKYHDGGSESAARAGWKAYAVKAIGAESATWDIYDEKVWVGSDARFDYYRVNKGKLRYKRGTALLQIKGRPYCQVRSWVALSVSGGAPTIESLEEAGTFTRCP